MASGNDKEVKIGITADTAGADEASLALETIKEAATEVGQAVAEAMGAAVDALNAKTEALQEQIAALETLTDAEAGVIDATKRQESEWKKPSLFSKDRIEGCKDELIKLAGALGDATQRFMETEKGQEVVANLMGDLADETTVFGSTAMKISGGVAEGFAAGGPIGGAIGGLTGLVKTFTDEYLDSQARIEEANRSLAQAQAEFHERNEQRRKDSVTNNIESMLEGEAKLLERQNTALRTQSEMWNARKENAQSDLERRKAEANLRGEDTSKFDKEKIQLDYDQTMSGLDTEKRRVDIDLAGAQRIRDFAKKAMEQEGASTGTAGPKYQARKEEYEKAETEAARLEEDRPGRLKAIEQRESTAKNRRATALANFNAGQKNKAQAAKEKEQAAAKKDAEAKSREAEKQKQQKEREEQRRGQERENIGNKAEDQSEQAMKVAMKVRPQLAAQIDKLGNALQENPTEKGFDELVKALSDLNAKFSKSSQDGMKLAEVMEEVTRLKGQLVKSNSGSSVSHKSH